MAGSDEIQGRDRASSQIGVYVFVKFTAAGRGPADKYDLGRSIRMAVKKVGEKYRCSVCGNEVTVTKVGGGTLVCCGQDMELISS